jgi:hypothetical protein
MNVRCRNSTSNALHERDRLAVYILSIGNVLQDPNRMLDVRCECITEWRGWMALLHDSQGLFRLRTDL